MHYFLCQFLLLALLPILPIEAKNLSAPEPLTWSNLPLKTSIVERLKKGQTYSSSQVTTSSDNMAQNLILKAATWHPRSCQVCLPILSQYENYHRHIDFIESSTYDQKTEKIYLLLSSPLLPFKMEMQLRFPRLTQAGAYNFTFDRGFLKDLQGQLQVAEVDGRCLFFLTADWSGPKSDIPNVVFEAFTQTLTEVGLNRLIKISNP